MTEKMKFAVAGVGAMGSRYAIQLSRAGYDVTAIDGWDKRIASVTKNGMRAKLNGEEVEVDIPIYDQHQIPDDVHFDVVIFLPKSMQLPEMVKDVVPHFDEDTVAVCLMNGIGHENTIAQYIPREKIYLGNTIWTASMNRPDHTLLEDDGSCAIRNIVPGEPRDSKAQEIVEVFNDAGLKARMLDNPRYSVFRKGCVNGTLNALCTLFECNIAQFGKTRTAHQMVVGIVKEFAAVAEHEGIHLDVPEVIKHVEDCYAICGAHYPSMHQDLIQNHRPTEIDYINGYVSKHGKEYGIPTPLCDLITAEIHAKEDVMIGDAMPTKVTAATA